jgi:CDP-glucose 4,6-dehydratase
MSSFFSSKRCLVTGSSGFIGTALCSKLTELGATVLPFDNKINRRTGGFQWQDVREYESLMAVFAAYSPQIVFHLAAETEVIKSFSRPHQTYSTNVLGTLNVLELCKQQSSKTVEAILVASSDKAYGYSSDYYYETSALKNSGDFYSSSKKAADELAQEYARLYNLPIAVLRCVNTYGPGQYNETTLITKTITRILKGLSPILYTDSANTYREWLYIDDVVNAYLLLAEAIATSIRPHFIQTYRQGDCAYNVGSGERVTNKNVIQRIQMLMNGGEKPQSIEMVQSNEPSIKSQGVCSDKFHAKLKHCLTHDSVFNPIGQVWMDKGLSKTIEWHKSINKELDK